MGNETLADGDHKRQRARELQRQRRAKKRRIDYYPSEAAAAVIDALCDAGQRGRDRSGVIDALILRTRCGASTLTV
ncbi:hypothetical protein FBR04_19390 [Betaproteobacteria bacterium PRO7]|nr:hypothetical protein [Betaproteobacteria bacterium PRO7]